jgi:hypothetical protein
MNIKRISDGEVFEVRKYIKGNGEESASEDLGFEALNTAIIPHIDQFTAEYGISGLELIPDSGNTR